MSDTDQKRGTRTMAPPDEVLAAIHALETNLTAENAQTRAEIGTLHNESAQVQANIAAFRIEQQIELGHINKRLDIHRKDISDLTEHVTQITQKFGAIEAVEDYKKKCEDDLKACQAELLREGRENVTEKRRFWRNTTVQVVMLFIGFLLSSFVGGWISRYHAVGSANASQVSVKSTVDGNMSGSGTTSNVKH